MNETELITRLEAVVQAEVVTYLQTRPVAEVASLDWMQALAQPLIEGLARASFRGWNEWLEDVGKQFALSCPRCLRRRRCKRRPGQQMKLDVLGLEILVPKLYMECDRCDSPGVSITKVLTGLRSGDATMELKLRAAYAGSEHSYGKAKRDIEVWSGQRLERTRLRRMALEVEQMAMEFAEQQRVEVLGKLEEEEQTEGVDRLMTQADGGSVRTGTLVECEPGDEGYGNKTTKTGMPKRKRVSQNREVITIDVRSPGQCEPAALDVLVPVLAPAGERSRRMLASAGRSGLGDKTHVFGLGDLGSKLPEAFDEAFVGHQSIYSADWTHVRKYVEEAMAVLEGNKRFKPARWEQQMLDAIWNRHESRRNKLLRKAKKHRVTDLPEYLERCPVAALDSYVTNNWHRMNAAKLKQMDLDFVSARAESQVRDRTKARFSVPGAWRLENIEGKATLRAIIAEGSWARFRRFCLNRTATVFERGFRNRLDKALAEGRLSRELNEKLAKVPGAHEALDMVA